MLGMLCNPNSSPRAIIPLQEKLSARRQYAQDVKGYIVFIPRNVIYEFFNFDLGLKLVYNVHPFSIKIIFNKTYQQHVAIANRIIPKVLTEIKFGNSRLWNVSIVAKESNDSFDGKNEIAIVATEPVNT